MRGQIIVMYFWFTVPTYPEYNLIEKGNSISNYLVASKLGKENMLNCTKIDQVVNLSYSELKDELNVNPYDMYVLFLNTTEVCGGNKTSFGETFTNTTYASSIIRIVHINDEIMPMNVIIYD
jgi:hypothetical protein